MQLPDALLSSSSINKTKSTYGKFLTFQEIKISYIFSKERFLIFWKAEIPKKIPLIPGNGTFLYFSFLYIPTVGIYQQKLPLISTLQMNQSSNMVFQL